jgi:hypothetical protein
MEEVRPRKTRKKPVGTAIRRTLADAGTFDDGES